MGNKGTSPTRDVTTGGGHLCEGLFTARCPSTFATWNSSDKTQLPELVAKKMLKLFVPSPRSEQPDTLWKFGEREIK